MVDGEMIPTIKCPKILGVTFDSSYTFSPHATAICNKVKSRNKVLKSLAGSTWGADKETLLTTYKAIGRSVVSYAAPVWSCQRCDTQWNNIQICQNAALRTATGCLLSSHVDHLDQETKILPVRRHNYMLSKQYLLGCYRRNHPNHHLVDRYPPPRSLKVDLHDLEREVQRYKREPLDQAGLNNIHADTVADALIGYRVNVVLGERPPPIAPEEIDLPRQTRVVLAQLRSGRCSRLNSHRARIDADVQDVCPDCNQGPHDTRHLFNCPARPTRLRPRSLWTHPILVAEFLGLDTQQNQADER
ncbi:uncharacterized protein LOC106085920 [Stomoxys calcitrans]|uniref:uncharacterized protein LOC106085920 n=1 Tax=Stomoxys calcitrans TaxID=35570 RepID=UPI0027E23404|nr:uncharacterized protein LOC106085920 [Stomoxys calcitrans]XP_059219027.1 uncharacterized protein LOC106085920 [Stomoxys calcitrans]